MKQIKYMAILLAFFLALGFGVNAAYAENIDPDDDGSQYSWGENVGWLNFEPDGDSGPGAEVGDDALTGYVWAENIGWISLSCENTASCGTVNYGIANDGQGNLSGYAWAENAGWINFASATGDGVFIDEEGNFDGWAWGENIGWIHLNNPGVPFKVKTAWAPLVCNLVNDLGARAKSGKVQLTWTHVDADSYYIYRKTEGDYELLANTTSTYSTYLDTDVVNGTTYFYLVTSVCGGSESAGSNEASATPTERTRRR